MAEARGARGDLDRWLAPFLDALGHKRRRTWAPLYVRGLLGPGERKSLQPMAARLGLSGHDQLQHFVPGKKASRQALGLAHPGPRREALVSLTLARGEVPVPGGLRLFLPDEWTRDPDRRARAGVPEAEVAARSKGAIALAELDRLRAAGVRFGLVLADAGYGTSAAFRHGLNDRHLLWAVGIPCTQKIYTTAVRLCWPRAARGRRRRTPVPSEAP